MRKARLTGKIVTPDSVGYNRARREYNRRFNKFPRVIVYCLQEKDVVNALNWAIQNKVSFRVRSGGHSYEGFSAIDGGLIIDVSKLQKIEVKKRKRIAKVQSGNQLERVNKQLFKHGLVLPTGSSPDVGIAGLTLGGGFGMLSRIYGLTCDNLFALDMIVIKGGRARKIHVTKKKFPELLWASRGGGGGNFGIVTNFYFHVRPICTVSMYEYTWYIKSPQDLIRAKRVLKVWQKWAPFTDRRLTSTIHMGKKEIFSTGQFLGNAKEMKKLLKPLTSTSPDKKLVRDSIPFIKAYEEFADDNLVRIANKFKTTGLYVNKLLPDKALNILIKEIQQAPNNNAFVWAQSLRGAVSDLSRKDTAYFHRRALFPLELSAHWQKNKEAAANIKWVNQFRKKLIPFGEGDYVNWPDRSIKDWPRAYYGKRNFSILKAIKAKFDPRNYFRFPQSIPPGKNKVL